MTKPATPLSASQSQHGEPILLTSLSAVTVDELASDSSQTASRYQLWIWAANNDTVRRKLTLTLGSQQVAPYIPNEAGFVLVVPGIPVSAALKVQAAPEVVNMLQVVVARKPLLTESEFQP